MKRPDKQLTTFIESQLAIGAHIEKIRSDLHTGEWNDADIDQALAYVESKKKRAPRKKGVRFSALVTLFFICVGLGVALFFFRDKIPQLAPSTPEPITFPDLTPKTLPPVATDEPTPATSTPAVDDFAEVRKAFDTEFSSAQFIRTSRLDADMIVTAVITDEFGSSTTRDLVFAHTEGVWKFSAYADPIATSTPLVEVPVFIVKDITVVPAPPLVNNRRTEFTISILNEGVVAFEDGVKFQLVFGDRAPIELAYPKKIDSGETIAPTYSPYAETGKKYADAPGSYKVEIWYDGAQVYRKDVDLY